MDETLTLNSGIVLNGYGIVSGPDLILYITGKTMDTLYHMLTVQANTVHIHENRYGEEKDYYAYTHLYCISEEGGGMVCAGLRKS